MAETCKLSDKKCSPCNKETPALSEAQVQEYLTVVDWGLSPGAPKPWIYKTFDFEDFSKAMAFINKMAEIIEAEDHHPDFHLYKCRYVRVSLITHAISGLSENDFIMAVKINAITV